MNQDLLQLAAILRQLSGDIVMAGFENVGYDIKADGSLITEIDTRMQAALIQALQKHYPAYDILGEEMSPEEQQKKLQSSDTGLWILDPLDGTSNFAAGIPIFSVSLALVRQGQVVQALIHDPVRDECFAAARGEGAWLNQSPLRLQEHRQTLSRCIAQVDLKRLPKPLAGRIATDHPFASQRNFGSGALDWCWLAAGRAQLYLHGGQKLWDYAAGQLILQEAGGSCMSFDQQPVYNTSLVPRPVIAATSDILQRQWAKYLLSPDGASQTE